MSLRSAGLLAAFVLAACSASGETPSATVRPLALEERLRPAHSLSGVIDTDTFVVPADAFDRVTGSLFVFASKSVDIRGVLAQVGDGATIAFFTPSFTLESGARIFAGGSRAASPQDKDVVSACQMFVAGQARWTVRSGENVMFVSDRKSTATDRCVTSFAEGAAITQFEGKTGQAGGSLLIGTTQAIAAADALAREHGHSSWRSFAPATVNVDGTLVAGRGGDGSDDASGTRIAGGYAFTGGNGGDGGSIDVVAGKITGTSPAFTAGRGGNAGIIGASIAYATSALNGTSSAPNGLPVAIHMGAGGEGGSVEIDAKKPKDLIRNAGSGGNASLITSQSTAQGFWAGNGYTPPAGGGGGIVAGNGGSVTLDLAVPGYRGSGGSANATGATIGQYYPVTFIGGDGGNPGWPSSYAYQPPATPGTRIRGGDGADLTIVLPSGVTAGELVAIYGLKISLNNFGMAGYSLLATDSTGQCPSTSPPGINGGNGGSLHDNGVWPIMYPTLANYGYGMYAGGGSAGDPPGTNGINGLDDEGQQIGQLGAQTGYKC